MLIVTRDKVSPTDLTPTIYLKDVDYLKLPTDSKLREALLSSLGLEVVIVDRLGHEITSEGVFSRPSKVESLPGYEYHKEVGFYIGL